MGAVTTSLGEQAKSIFDEIGYTVSRTDTELRAAHKWREVRITVCEAHEELPDSGELRCFVTWASMADDLERRLSRRELPYDWAVIGVRDDGGYDVVRPDTPT